LSKVAFYTLGCKLNQYDSDAIASLFAHDGWDIVDFYCLADVYIINTCTVTAMADRKSRQTIRRVHRRNPKARVVVVGCYAQQDSENIAKIEGVDIVMGTGNRLGVLDAVYASINGLDQAIIIDNQLTQWEETPVGRQLERTRAYLKVQEGCDNYCTYCAICRVRGSERSRPINKAIDEAIKLIEIGYKEIVITGIHLSSYGRDFDEDYELIDLVEAICELDGDFRLRLGSLEPSTATEDFSHRISLQDKVCKHFHISMQSGSDSVLKNMNRKYTSSEYLRFLDNIRKFNLSAAITTDIMVGFPGESDDDFVDSCDTVIKAGFANTHIFQFSPRKNTPAADCRPQINGNIKKERLDIMAQLSKAASRKSSPVIQRDRVWRSTMAPADSERSASASSLGRLNRSKPIGA